MTITRFPHVLAAAAVALFAAVPAAADFGGAQPVIASSRAPYLEGAPTPMLLLLVGSLMIAFTLGRKVTRTRHTR